MRLWCLPAVFLIAINSIPAFTKLSHHAPFDSLSHAIPTRVAEAHSPLLAALIVRRDKSIPATLRATPAPTFVDASTLERRAHGKKSTTDTADTTTTDEADITTADNQSETTTPEQTSQPTLSAGDSVTTAATSTTVNSPSPTSSPSLSSAISSVSTSTPSASSTSSFATSSSTPSSSSSPAATSPPSKSSVSSGLIAGIVLAIIFVLAALIWVISMRRHLRQREWMFKYHERIFDGPDGLLSKKQQVQQQQKEARHKTTYPTSTDGTGLPKAAKEKHLLPRPDGVVTEPERVYGHRFSYENVAESERGYMPYQRHDGALNNSGFYGGKVKRKPVTNWKSGP